MAALTTNTAFLYPWGWCRWHHPGHPQCLRSSVAPGVRVPFPSRALRLSQASRLWHTCSRDMETRTRATVCSGPRRCSTQKSSKPCPGRALPTPHLCMWTNPSTRGQHADAALAWAQHTGAHTHMHVCVQLLLEKPLKLRGHAEKTRPRKPACESTSHLLAATTGASPQNQAARASRHTCRRCGQMLAPRAR